MAQTTHRPAQRGHRHLPGDDAVPPAGQRHPGALPAADRCRPARREKRHEHRNSSSPSSSPSSGPRRRSCSPRWANWWWKRRRAQPGRRGHDADRRGHRLRRRPRPRAIRVLGVLAAAAAAALAVDDLRLPDADALGQPGGDGAGAHHLRHRLFGAGRQGLPRQDRRRRSARRFPPELAEHPLWRVVFGYSPLVYFVAAHGRWRSAWFLKPTRAGLILRAVGENDHSAHSIGYSVIGVRYAAVAFGGAMAGIAGSCFSMVLTPMWAEGLTAGRGWIALALVVFAAWRPFRLLAGAYLFGAVMTLRALRQGGRRPVLGRCRRKFWAALPYLATILVLVLISLRRDRQQRAHRPASASRSFQRLSQVNLTRYSTGETIMTNLHPTYDSQGRRRRRGPAAARRLAPSPRRS